MGVLGRYIDGLPPHARDRLIQAQDWCVAAVSGPDGSRCLVGHAEDWQPLAEDDGWWSRWVHAGAGSATHPESDVDLLCRPELFAFRRARPADLDVYRERLCRWGVESEARIGARFDQLCVRCGVPGAIRVVKRRAGRAFAIPAVASDGSSRAKGVLASR
ncbi:MAG TPA: hypothetical protein VGC13_06755 [Longimicrobium sp.]|uniref:hypothetical protein n=1 Tax=Longimicrobium sp. TaxID=2029185 RepID=UPI002EDB9890